MLHSAECKSEVCGSLNVSELRLYCQFCCCTCFFNANWPKHSWWRGECCLYNVLFHIRVLAVKCCQWPVWRWLGLMRGPNFFYNMRSHKNAAIASYRNWLVEPVTCLRWSRWLLEIYDTLMCRIKWVTWRETWNNAFVFSSLHPPS